MISLFYNFLDFRTYNFASLVFKDIFKKLKNEFATKLKNSAESLSEWAEFAKQNCKGKDSDIVKCLKEYYNLGLFFDDLNVHKKNCIDTVSHSDDKLIAL